MSDALKYVNLTVEGWGLLFCLLSAAILLIATKIDRATRRYFLAIFSLLFLDLISNIGGLLLRGQMRSSLVLSQVRPHFLYNSLTVIAQLCEHSPVEDDGVGFDPKKPPADGRTHFGLQLVRDRLHMLCGATLTIQSSPGHGTRVRLFLPKTLD